LGDRIKAMYMTLEGMEGAGISTVGEEVESLEDLMRQNRSA
jgi:thymidylate kinase